MNPDHGSCHSKCIHCCLSQEISAVNQADPDCFSGILCRLRPLQCKKWIELVAAVPAHTVNSLNSLVERCCFHITFSCPCPGQLDHLISVVRQIQIQAHGTLQNNAALSLMDKSCISDNYRQILKNRVGENYLCIHHPVSQVDLQCFCLLIGFCINSRQPFEFPLPFQNHIVFKRKFCNTASVFLQNLIGRFSHIPVAVGRIFLFQIFHGECPVTLISTRRHIPHGIFDQMLKTLPVFDFSAIINLSRLSVS